MPSSASWRRVVGSRGSARMPACTCGCSVLTRPSRHSGKPVRSSTAVTGHAGGAIRAAVEPVETMRDAGLVQAAGQLVEAGLVVDGDEGPADGTHCPARGPGGG